MLRVLRQLFGGVLSPEHEPITFSEIFNRFENTLLPDHDRAMEIIADLAEKSCGEYIFDRKYLLDSVRDLQNILLRMIRELNLMGSNRYMELYSTLDRVFPTHPEFSGRLRMWDAPYVVSLDEAPMGNMGNFLLPDFTRPS
jgi:hypothetical protein